MIEVTDEMVRRIQCCFSPAIVQKGYVSKTQGVTIADYNDVKDVIKNIIELHEANKPKPEPVAYLVRTYHDENTWVSYGKSEEWAETLANNYGDGTYQPLYTTPPTREPLSDYELREMLNDLNEGDGTIYDFARLIEQAHGIGGES